jgi:hypothetical protein
VLKLERGTNMLELSKTSQDTLIMGFEVAPNSPVLVFTVIPVGEGMSY